MLRRKPIKKGSIRRKSVKTIAISTTQVFPIVQINSLILEPGDPIRNLA